MSSFFLKPPASSASSTGGLFGSAPAQPTGGLFGSTGGQQQAQQSGGIFGSQQQTQQPGGIFGSQQQTQQPSGLFGAPAAQSQPQQSGGLFANTSGIFGNQSQQQQQSSGLFGSTGGGGGLFNTAQNQQQSQQQSNNTRAQIDLEHLRPTTKFDHLTPALQSEIESLDTHILSEIHKHNELAGALPSIIDSGKSVPQDYKYVREKFDELSLALENDAADIVDLRDNVVKKDLAEGRLCFKSIDRLKMPSQYQQQSSSHHTHTHGAGGPQAVYGGSGLSGWWNNPTVSTRTRHGTQKNVVSVDDDADVEIAGGTLVDLLNGRADEMGSMLRERKGLLEEIEGFVGNVEGKILMRERELVDGTVAEGKGERERQIKMLRYVFGEVERSLYEVADRVGESRDGVMDLAEKASRARLAY
jgi:nucleoporin p58/p45